MFQSTPAYVGRRNSSALARASSLFQSTPAYGGRPTLPGLRHSLTCFNPRPRTAGDSSVILQRRQHSVSIHARVRRATSISQRPRSPSLFQSTPAYGGRQTDEARAGAVQGFNPRPRTAGDGFVDPLSDRLFVSIHARVRRATSSHRRRNYLIEVSIHARVRRATMTCSTPSTVTVFQSTPAYGGRPDVIGDELSV